VRVLMTHVYGWPGARRGAERYLHELAAGMQRAGHDVEVVITAPTAGRGDELGVPVRRLKRRHGMHRRFGEYADQVAFGAQTLPIGLLRRHHVWHAMSTADAAAAAFTGRLRPRLRAVATEMGIPDRAYRSTRPDHPLFEFAVRHLDELVCLSPPAAQALQRDYGRPGVVVPGGVDLSWFVPAPQRTPRPTLLFPGSLSEPRKNAQLFLEAVSLLAARGVAVDVWLAGPGDLPAQLSPAAEAGLGRVTLRRMLDLTALRDAYAAAWVTVLPSASEVFGLVVLESLASGTPAVVLDDGMGPALLVDSAVGRRCAAKADALADACVETIELAREAATGDACRARAERYDWDRAIVPRLLDVYAGRA